MKVEYHIKNKRITGETADPSIIISNNNGGFLNLSSPTSKYQGWFVKDEDSIFKVLESIELIDDAKIKKIINQIHCIKRNREGFSETYMFPKNYNSLVYQLTKEKEVQIVLDVREIYNLDENKRNYEVRIEKDQVLITFNKEGKVLHLVISGLINPVKVDQWKSNFYIKDKNRNSPPFERYVYAAIRGKTKRLIISAYINENKAKEENKMVSKGLSRINKNERASCINPKKTNEDELSYILAANSLLGLVKDTNGKEGLMAGLPWFFQIWCRDAAVSLGAFPLINEEQVAKKMFMILIKAIQDGKLPALFPSSEKNSADAVGWLFHYGEKFFKLMDGKEKNLVKSEIKNCIDNLIKKHHKNGFFLNNPLETWMDTGYVGDERAGIRIEIQVLIIRLFDVAFRLTRDKIYRKLRDSLIKNVREHMYKEGYLWDGVGDNTIRPNIFLSYVVYPRLLKKAEWVRCFDIALDALWLEWGGLSTIDKSNPLFQPYYTGEDNRSYHRGDSWYWVNNLAAIAMQRLDKKKYSDNIKKIYEASKKDILWMGAVGSASELSSAAKQTADGCLDQAWSNATFIQLYKELK